MSLNLSPISRWPCILYVATDYEQFTYNHTQWPRQIEVKVKGILQMDGRENVTSDSVMNKAHSFTTGVDKAFVLGLMASPDFSLAHVK